MPARVPAQLSQDLQGLAWIRPGAVCTILEGDLQDLASRLYGIYQRLSKRLPVRGVESSGQHFRIEVHAGYYTPSFCSDFLW